MFRRPSDEPNFNVPINNVLTYMADIDPDAEDYAKLVDRLETLTNLRDASRPKPLSADTVVSAAANILGIIFIVGHERTHIVTSKALMFIKQLR